MEHKNDHLLGDDDVSAGKSYKEYDTNLYVG